MARGSHSLKIVGLACAFMGSLIGSAVAAGTLDKVRDSGKFVIGHREASPPFSSLDANGNPVGYSIDLCKRIAAAVGNELGLDGLEVSYKPVTSENRIAMLLNGEVDIVCGSSTNTLKRQEEVDFTLLTFITGAEMLVGVNSGINGLKDLSGKTVGVVSGTTTEAGLKKALQKRFIDAEIIPVEDHDDGLKMLEANEIEAYASDRVLLIGLARKAKDPSQFMLTNRLYSYEPYAFMVRPNDTAFRLVADRTLASLYRSGAIAEIYETWFGNFKKSASDLLKALYVLQGLPEG